MCSSVSAVYLEIDSVDYDYDIHMTRTVLFSGVSDEMSHSAQNVSSSRVILSTTMSHHDIIATNRTVK